MVLFNYRQTSKFIMEIMVGITLKCSELCFTQ